MNRTPGRLLRSVVGCWTVVAVVALAAPAAQAAPPPEITAFSPACGAVGTSVAIGGDHLQGATSVDFNGTVAIFNVNSANLITATVPTGATTGKIRVFTPDGSTTSRDDFTVSSSCAPSITSFSPPSGPVGSSVTINGSIFVGTTSVKFNVTSATAFSWNPSGTQLTATVPSGATTGKIAVTTPSGTATSAQDFTVTPPTPPTITGFSPTSGPVGSVVTITGTGFTGATSVKFGTTSAAFTVNSGTQITATVPKGATTGKISVTTPLGTATSAANFTVTTVPAPTITSFVPISGPVGTSVVITGTNLTGVTAVKFKNTSATTFTVNSATQITAVVPSGAQTGKISVTTPGGTARSSSNFTVTAAGSPTITSFSPTSGPVGTSVTIVGTNFTGTTSVKFGGVAATSFTVSSSTQITAVVPAGAKTGRITVTNSSGTGTSATNFTVLPTFHDRSISLALRRHLVARGNVRVSDGFAACYRNVRVRIQRRVSGEWRTIDATFTDDTGFYRERVPDRVGRYRAVAPRVELANDICRRAVSRVVLNA